jgi:hypothetical protein
MGPKYLQTRAYLVCGPGSCLHASQLFRCVSVCNIVGLSMLACATCMRYCRACSEAFANQIKRNVVDLLHRDSVVFGPSTITAALWRLHCACVQQVQSIAGRCRRTRTSAYLRWQLQIMHQLTSNRSDLASCKAQNKVVKRTKIGCCICQHIGGS